MGSYYCLHTAAEQSYGGKIIGQTSMSADFLPAAMFDFFVSADVQVKMGENY